jgi:hypothetical protein
MPRPDSDKVVEVWAKIDAFEHKVLETLKSAGFEFRVLPLVAGQRLDAIVMVPFENRFRIFGVEIKYVGQRMYSPRVLDSALFRPAYPKHRSLIDTGLVILNAEPQKSDQIRAAEMGVAVLSAKALERTLEAPERIFALLNATRGDEVTADKTIADVVVAVELAPKKRLFVAIHFTDHNDDVFNFGISSAAARLGMEAYRISDVEHNEIIVERIRKEIDKKRRTNC